MADQEPCKDVSPPSAVAFATPFDGADTSDADHTDGRHPAEWRSRYPAEARKEINFEAAILAITLIFTLGGASLCLGIAGGASYSFKLLGADVSVSFRLLAIFLTGAVGGTTFSIKWLIHSVAKGKWHLDRRYWRLLVPLIGGVYASVVMTLFGAGLFAPTTATGSVPIASTAALAFLVGYFSDGVSGLLSNVANAVFGTLEKK